MTLWTVDETEKPLSQSVTEVCREFAAFVQIGWDGHRQAMAQFRFQSVPPKTEGRRSTCQLKPSVRCFGR